MKKYSLILLLLSFALTAFSQAPQSFQYQAVVRNPGGDIIANQTVGMQISLRQGTPFGPVVYQETHTPTSNAFGLVNLQVGTGTVVSGAFASIDWGVGPYHIEVGLDPTGGTNYTITGSSQLLSVPYALYAKYAETTAETNNGITGGFFRGDTLKLTREDGSVLNIVPCGVKNLQVSFNCLGNTAAGNTDQVEVALSYTGMDANAVIVNNGMGIIGGDNPATTPNGTILVTGLTEGDSWNIVITGGYNGSCYLESSGTVPSNYCVPCGITSLAQANIACLSNTPGDNNDQVTVEIPYTGVDPGAVVINNGSGTIGGDNPSTVANGTILITGLMEGGTWNISITGGASGDCILNSFGEIYTYHCNPCGITDLDTPQEVTYQCVSNTPALNNDWVFVYIDYSGLADPGTEIITSHSNSGDNPVVVADGTIKLGGYTVLKEGDNWSVSITGGPSNDCNFISAGTVPSGVCSDIQYLLDNGWTPGDILAEGRTVQELYGKTYQGGLIFYVNTNTNPVTGLVAAPADLVNQSWECSSTSIATGTAVGTGSTNTTLMLGAGCSSGAINTDNYSNGGYTDFFMPSRDEMNLMYTNLHQLGYGNFNSGPSTGRYWSSSQSSPTQAYVKKFGDGSVVTENKTNVARIRPIRAF